MTSVSGDEDYNRIYYFIKIIIPIIITLLIGFIVLDNVRLDGAIKGCDMKNGTLIFVECANFVLQKINWSGCGLFCKLPNGTILTLTEFTYLNATVVI